MKTILSDMNNKVDISTLKKSEVKKLLKETQRTLKDARYFLDLPLTEAECGYYEDTFRACKADILIIEEFIK